MADWQLRGTVETLEIASIYRKTFLVRTKEESTVADIVAALDQTQSRIVLLMVGGAEQPDSELQEKLKALFSGTILPAAIDADALILDGTPPATMQLLGDCIAFRRHAPVTVGVAPASCVTFPGSTAQENGLTPLNLDHSTFVLAPGDQWGAELPVRYVIARALNGSLPVIVVAVNGGPASQREILCYVRQEWPVLIVEGTGGLADQIATLKKSGTGAGPGRGELGEIVSSAHVRVVQTADQPDMWQQLLEGRPKDDETLGNVWDDFRRWDVAAMNYQTQFRRLQWTGIALGVGATLVAILQPKWPVGPVGWVATPRDHFLHVTVIAIPILTTILFAFMNHFRPGNRWLLLRGGAESIKREIFRYRTRTGIYSDEQRGLYRATRLGQEVDKIMKAMAQSEANRAGEPKIPELKKQEEKGDLSALTGDEYVSFRLKDQISYYERTTRKLDRSARWYNMAIFVAGGVGTFLAAIGVNVWVALSTAVVTGLTAKLEAEQQENSLIQYKQSLAALKSILNWWTSLSLPLKKEQANLDRLVNETELTLASELAGWVQQMQSAIDKAQKGPVPDNAGEGGPKADAGAKRQNAGNGTIGTALAAPGLPTGEQPKEPTVQVVEKVPDTPSPKEEPPPGAEQKVAEGSGSTGDRPIGVSSGT